MEIQLRPVVAADAEACGRIIFEAFKNIADRHNFRRDFPSEEVATEFARFLIENPMVYGIVAEGGGKVLGSNFLSEFDSIRGVGPITVDPDHQGYGIGRRLMVAVIERGRNAAGIRLLQDSFNTASLSLYASLGFDVKEPVVIIEGKVAADLPPNIEVRRMKEEDLKACAELHKRVHGFERANELRNLPPMCTPFVALREGRVTAYTAAPTFWPLNHGVAEGKEDMQALLAGASAANEASLSFLLPTRQSDFFRWCLSRGLRVVKPMTLMAMGEYQEPRGNYLTSVLY